MSASALTAVKDRPVQDALEVMGGLDGGVFAQKLGRALRDVSHSVSDLGEKGRVGKITIELTVARNGDTGSQVMVTHGLSYTKLTRHGKVTEVETKTTPMWVDQSGMTADQPRTYNQE